MIWRFLSSLQFRMAVVFLVVSTVPLGIVGLFAVRTADRLIGSIVANQLENMAAEKQELLERWIAERKADLAVVAGSAAVQGLDPGPIAPYLKLVQERYGVYKRFVVADDKGRSVYDTAGHFAESVSAEAYWRHALARGTYLSNVSLEPGGEESVFRIAEPIPGPQGSPRGVVCATVTTRAIHARVLSVSLGETGECYLVDRTGLFLAHREPWRVLKENIAQSESFANIFDESHSGPIYTDYRGIAVLGASRPVRGTPDTHWYLVVEQDRDEAFASSYRMRGNIAVAAALTVVGAIVLSWMLASYVTSPIRALSAAAEALSRGEFEKALTQQPPRRDEIGALHASFRHMAQQLRERHGRLEERIGVTQEELRRSDEKLQSTLVAAATAERLAALGRLASGVAHEIRTPLTSLKLYFQSIRDEVAVVPELAEDYEVATRQVQRMESTINHFLDFARPREPALAAVDFSRLVDEALLVAQPRANQQDVEVVRSVEGGLPEVQGDSRQLGEALVNLLVNALEAMPDGGRLTISVAPLRDDLASASSPWVRIDVADTGSGIREADLDRLFEPFFTTKATGSGLGLAIVRGIIERHSGSIRVRSRPGEGTTFSIFLPAANADSLPAADAKET